jgi:hypothetical protein
MGNLPVLDAGTRGTQRLNDPHTIAHASMTELGAGYAQQFGVIFS